MRYRVEWAKYQERERKKEEEEREKERVAYAQIDWHDFVVVETVDFQPIEQGSISAISLCMQAGNLVVLTLFAFVFLPSRSLPSTHDTRGAWRSHPYPGALREIRRKRGGGDGGGE